MRRRVDNLVEPGPPGSREKPWYDLSMMCHVLIGKNSYHEPPTDPITANPKLRMLTAHL